jgi:hypothetical protein
VQTSVQKLTLEQFMQQYAGKRYEYIDGVAVPMGIEMVNDERETFVPPAKPIHGLDYIPAQVLSTAA